MGHKLDKFVLLMWKNWLLQWRHPIQTIVEILAPVLFSALLVLIRGLVDPDEHDPIVYQPFQATMIPSFNNYTLAYSPENVHLTKIVNDVVASLNMTTLPIVPLPDSKQMVLFFQQEVVLTKVMAGIQFDDALAGDVELPKNLHAALRFPGQLRSTNPLSLQNTWQTNLLFPMYQIAGPRSYSIGTTAFPGYYQEGFLGVQEALSMAIIKHFSSTFNAPQILMRRFPYPKWINDPLLTAMQSIIGIVIMLSFVYTCISTVKVITTEKEKQLKEAMKIMGLPNWLHWTAWFLKTFAFLLISIILMVVLLKVPWFPYSSFSVFTLSDPGVIFLFLILYMCATITFCFAISVFFSKANTAAAIAGLVWFLSYAPYLFLQEKYDTLSLTVKMVSSFGSNTAMAFGFQLMLMFEGTGEGLQWSNIFKTTTPDDNLTLGLVMTMLVIDTVIYLLVALYVEAVMPGEYGVPQVWYFPFTSAFWFGQPRNTGIDSYPESSPPDSTLFEKEPVNLSPGIQIKHLRKTYSNKKTAVRDLSLNMYNGQITVLLGHNGAGKTTTMSMLTGMFPPTGGTALVNSYDICMEMDKVRESLGLCPQHNILFDELTVEEHLYFFSKLKGLGKAEIESEIQKYIELLELVPKAKNKSCTLSGGMKRKLCVGIALCGNSKIVMLDEPTAGMDPSARRALWELMQKQKEGRTILLTTHFMDEADVLGDRIAIMAGGQLQCCGSSFFLKKKYGAGYHLVMDVSPKCNPKDVTVLMKKHIPDIQIESSYGSELTYLLNENHSELFEVMLQDLESNSENLGIESYGISLTTLEEVFMKVGADLGQEEINDNKELATDKQYSNPNGLHSNVSDDSKVEIVDQHLLSGFELYKNQLLAMFMKRGLSTVRSWILFVIQIFLPVIFLIIAIVVTRNSDTSRDLAELKFTLGSYDNPVTVINDTNKYRDKYIENLQKSNNQLIDYKKIDLAQNIMDLTEQNPAQVRLRYIVGSTFHENSSITAWFNNQPYHSPPLALKLAIDAIVNTELGSDYSIELTNHPLPFTLNAKFKMLSQTGNMGFQLAFNIGFSMAFVSSFYILFYIRERVSKSKHLQFVSGVNIYTFWLVSFVCDFLTFILTALCILVTLVSFQEDGFKTGEEIGRMLLIFIYFGFGMLPMIYLFAYLFDIPSTGYTRMTFFSIFTGVAAFMVVQILATDGLDLEYVADTLHWVFLLIPHYSMCTGIRDSHSVYSAYSLCKTLVDMCEEAMQQLNRTTPVDCWKQVCDYSERCCDVQTNYFTWEAPGILRNIVFSFSVGIGLMIVLLLIEQNLFNNLIYKLRNQFLTPPDNNEMEDTDVMDEKLKVQRLQPEEINDYAIVLRDVTKYYKKFLAVNNLCLGIKSYECFGLLGVNGAGKTTTFKMMTGDVPISFGEAWVKGYSLKKDLKKVHQNIGYCPQFDALLDDLTGRETLQMFCLLRGVPIADCPYVVEKLSRDFDFRRHLSKKVKEYSGGNKRKLSTAIALIGDPPVIYLDEPTTGMDPATKRHLWDALCSVRENGKCIVLTSHSMEECEALCTRLAIMVNGQFKCLGSTQHLKSKFSEGYTLTVKIKKTSDINVVQPLEVENIDRFVKTSFHSAILREQYQEMLTYYIPDKTLPWSRMFGIMESGKKSLNIEDYSLGQSSLEQVFLSFTKLQVVHG